MLVEFPDGTTVLAHGRPDLGLVPAERPRPPDFALYLDERWHGDASVSWPHRIMAWPDFGVPDDEEEVRRSVDDLHRRAKAGELVEIACYGGIGRTGTVLACLATRAGVAPDEAVEWVRTHYHPSAIETLQQRKLIDRLAPEIADGR